MKIYIEITKESGSRDTEKESRFLDIFTECEVRELMDALEKKMKEVTEAKPGKFTVA